jgi:hypothetical protein
LNIDHEILSPGIDGLAKALRDRISHLLNTLGTKRIDISRIGAAPLGDADTRRV